MLYNPHCNFLYTLLKQTKSTSQINPIINTDTLFTMDHKDDNFTIPTNPIQERLQQQRNAMTSSNTATTSQNLRRIPVIQPPNSSQQRARSQLAPPTTASFPSLNSAQRAGGARKKVVLEQGCSPLDWARLNSSGQNLRGIEPHQFPLKVDKEMLKLHKQKNDCWTVLKGKVYNITPYVKFHPGGVEEIMKCAGKDGTTLFNKYHAWVNFERMLENCFIGFYIG